MSRKQFMFMHSCGKLSFNLTDITFTAILTPKFVDDFSLVRHFELLFEPRIEFSRSFGGFVCNFCVHAIL